MPRRPMGVDLALMNCRKAALVYLANRPLSLSTVPQFTKCPRRRVSKQPLSRRALSFRLRVRGRGVTTGFGSNPSSGGPTVEMILRSGGPGSVITWGGRATAGATTRPRVGASATYAPSRTGCLTSTPRVEPTLRPTGTPSPRARPTLADPRRRRARPPLSQTAPWRSTTRALPCRVSPPCP